MDLIIKTAYLEETCSASLAASSVDTCSTGAQQWANTFPVNDTDNVMKPAWC